ncbi:phosphotransferase enzyme family protein [Natronospora cellulosivora (SeqCode)]
MINENVLHKSADSFQFEKKSLKFVSNSTNLIYEFERSNRSYILRFSERPLECVNGIKAEIEWLDYLKKNGVSVSQPIKTKNEEFLSVIQDDGRTYIVTAFEKAQGVAIDEKDDNIWNAYLFQRWGQTMGKIHSLSKKYKIADKKVKRGEWDEGGIYAPDLHLNSYDLVIEKWWSLLSDLRNLSKDKDSYGLIHNDFHHYNFLLDKDKINVFDFDDSVYGWFISDIAIALYHAVWWGAPEKKHEREGFAKKFLDSFMEGYSKENSIIGLSNYLFS